MMFLVAQDAARQPDPVYLIWGGVLLGVAIGLLILELFVPSGGLIGVLAGVAAVSSLVAFFMYDTTLGFAMTLAYIILAPIAIIGMFKLWVNSPIGKRMILGGREGGAAMATDDVVAAAEEARQKRAAVLRQLIGTDGVTVTALRPVGTVRIGDRRLDALAETGVIEPNTPVVVTDVYDNQIKVRPAAAGR